MQKKKIMSETVMMDFFCNSIPRTNKTKRKKGEPQASRCFSRLIPPYSHSSTAVLYEYLLLFNQKKVELIRLKTQNGIRTEKRGGVWGGAYDTKHTKIQRNVLKKEKKKKK